MEKNMETFGIEKKFSSFFAARKITRSEMKKKKKGFLWFISTPASLTLFT
jgi:hypothetical protein